MKRKIKVKLDVKPDKIVIKPLKPLGELLAEKSFIVEGDLSHTMTQTSAQKDTDADYDIQKRIEHDGGIEKRIEHDGGMGHGDK